MGNNSVYDQYNKRGDVDIYLSFKKVCFFPGEKMDGNIKLIPKMGLYNDCRKFCELNITMTQHSYYIYPVGSDYETDEEKIILMTHKFRFSDFINLEDEIEMNLPVSYVLPTYTRPSIYINNRNYVKHFICVEYPHFNIKRTFLFVVKNHLVYHSRNRTLLCPFTYPTTFNKKKFFKKKGSCQLVINMPRNYFLYNEKVGYNIHIDCRLLQIPVYKVKVTFCRTTKKNFSNDILRTRRTSSEQLFYKEYNLDKKQKTFNVIDYIVFSDPSAPMDSCISPSEIYQQMDNHGLYEIDDQSLRSLYPSCSEGLLVLEYSLRVKVYFDTIFTSDEFVFVPVDFCDLINYNIPQLNQVNNMNNMNINNNINNSNNINQIQVPNNPKPNLVNNNNININNNIINNNNINDSNSINNINIINEGSAPPMIQGQNIDGKKNFLEDNEKLNLSDWVVIDK